jgi:hypothetical protein
MARAELGKGRCQNFTRISGPDVIVLCRDISEQNAQINKEEAQTIILSALHFCVNFA